MKYVLGAMKFVMYNSARRRLCIIYFDVSNLHVACMGEERKVCRVLVGNPEGKRPFGRPRCRWENGIRMDLMEIGWGR
jgi:hypothetical protein